MFALSNLFSKSSSFSHYPVVQLSQTVSQDNHGHHNNASDPTSIAAVAATSVCSKRYRSPTPPVTLDGTPQTFSLPLQSVLLNFERDPEIDTARTTTFSQCSTESSQEATPRAPLAVDSSDFLAVANAHEKTSIETSKLLGSTAQGRRAQRQGRRAARLQKPDHMDIFMDGSSETYTEKEMLKEQQELVLRMCRLQDEEIVEKVRVKAEEKIKEEQLQMMRLVQEQLQMKVLQLLNLRMMRLVQEQLQMKVLQLLEPANVTLSSSPSQTHVSYILRYLRSAASEFPGAPSKRSHISCCSSTVKRQRRNKPKEGQQQAYQSWYMTRMLVK
jgi:hypothetical protein